MASFSACIAFILYAMLLSKTAEGWAVTPPRNLRTTPCCSSSARSRCTVITLTPKRRASSAGEADWLASTYCRTWSSRCRPLNNSPTGAGSPCAPARPVAAPFTCVPSRADLDSSLHHLLVLEIAVDQDIDVHALPRALVIQHTCKAEHARLVGGRDDG